MARNTTPKPPASTPGQPEHNAILLALQEMRGDLTPILARLKRLEEGQEQMAAQQATAERRQDDRITGRLAMLDCRMVDSTDRAIEVVNTLTTVMTTLPELIEKAGSDSVTKIVGLRKEAAFSMDVMRHAVVTEVATVQSEAVTFMEGMRNAGINAVGGLGSELQRKVTQAGDLAAELIEKTAITGKSGIEETAATSKAEFLKATAEATRAFKLISPHIQTLESSVSDLRRMGSWLRGEIEGRTWQVARATGVSAVATAGLALVVYRTVIWALGGGF